MCQAIKILKSNGIKDEEMQTILSKKHKLKNSYLASVTKLLRGMNLHSNILKISDGWYGVRWMDEKGNLDLKIDFLREHDICLLERDGRTQRELSRSEMDTLLPGMIDEDRLEQFKKDIKSKGIKMLDTEEFKAVLGCRIYSIPVEEGVEQVVGGIDLHNPKVSAHAGLRWVQRKLKVPVLQSEEYKKNHRVEIESAILEAWNKAEKVWTGEDGIEYWIDDDNFAFIVGNGTVITLYQEDFGFALHINRSIIDMQLEEVRKSFESYKEAEKEFDECSVRTEEEISVVESEIKVIQAHLELLTSRKSMLLSTKDQMTKALSLGRERYSSELNRLFRVGE
jgi:hypothetical protein